MYIDKVFDEIKQAMVNELGNLSLSDYERYNEWLRPHHNIIENLLEIQNINQKHNRTEPEPLTIEPETTCTEPETEEPVAEYPIGHTFTFAKKAYGGVLEELSYPIPEDLVRGLELENKNILRITSIKGLFPDKTPIYEVEVVDRTETPNPDLADIKQGIVEKHGSRLVVTKTTNGPIVFNDSPTRLIISDKDKHRLKIQEGDIINGRFYTNNLSGSFRATYKYSTHVSTMSKPVEAKRLLHRQNNSVETECGPSMIDQLDKTPFLNTRILLVGLASRMNDFTQMLGKTNEIDFVHLSGDDHKAKTRAQILKADIVLIATVENSHDTSTYVADICNQYNIPCRSTHEDGLSGVLRDAKSLIEKVAA